MENTIHSHILHLQEAMKQNRLVVFVGAGASASVGVPTWTKLIQSFKSELPPEMYDEGDPLKTAEAYRELRGDAEYLSQVKKVLKYGETSSGLVHDAIMNLDPCHIITTNYDDLLEQAAAHNNKQYYVVAKDEDLPLNKGEKMIIKMHGDFINNNIVLTENDYYDYRRNFPLISSFLLSLFATKVVLFVGFSFNDYNLKYILRHVSSILGNKMQRVYLLTDEEKNALAYLYFRNKSVQLLSVPKVVSSEIIKDQKIKHGNTSILSERSLALYQALCVLQNFDAHYDSIIEKAEYSLSLYQDQIRYWGKYLPKLFMTPSKEFLIRMEEASIYFMTDVYKKKFEEILQLKEQDPEAYKKYKHQLEWIRQRLIDNGVESIDKTALFTDEERAKWKAEVRDDASDIFYHLDIVRIEERLDNLSHRALNYTIEDLELPYLQYRLGMYAEAYNTYKVLAPEMWKRRKYILYFLCLYNMHASFGRTFMEMPFRKDKNMREWAYVQSIRLDDILADLPIENNVKEILYDLQSGILQKNLLIKTSELKDKLSKQKESAEKGGMSINSHVIMMLREYGEAFNFGNENYILTDVTENTKTAYVKMGEGLVNSVLTPTAHSQWQSKIDALPEMVVELFVFLIGTSDLINILSIRDGQKLPVEEEFKKRLQEHIRNLAKETTQNHREKILNNRVALEYISNIILLQDAIVDPLETPEIYKLLATYWGNGLLVDSAVKRALSRMMEHQKPAADDALLLLASLSQATSRRETDDANLICVLAHHVHEGGLVYKEFPGIQFVSKYQGVECVASYYHALPEDGQKELVDYVRNNVTDLKTLLYAEIHTEAHYITGELIEKLMPMVKKDHSLREPEEYICYILVRLLQDERYSDVHETILNLSKDIEVLRFLCAPEEYEIGAIKAHWLRYLTDEQLKKLLEHKAIRKKIILYSEKNKWDETLLEKMHQLDKE